MYVEYLGGIFMSNICLEYSCRIFASPNKKIYFYSYCCKKNIVVVNIVYFFLPLKIQSGGRALLLCGRGAILGCPPYGTGVPPGRDLGPVTGVPPGRTWDQWKYYGMEMGCLFQYSDGVHSDDRVILHSPGDGILTQRGLFHRAHENWQKAAQNVTPEMGNVRYG